MCRKKTLNSRSKILDLKIKFLKFLTIVFTNILDIGFFLGGWVVILIFDNLQFVII